MLEVGALRSVDDTNLCLLVDDGDTRFEDVDDTTALRVVLDHGLDTLFTQSLA